MLYQFTGIETSIGIMTSSNGILFRITVPLCCKTCVESTGHRWFSSQRDGNADLWYFYIVSLNKQMNKHLIGRQFKTRWRSFDVALVGLHQFQWCNAEIYRWVFLYFVGYTVMHNITGLPMHSGKKELNIETVRIRLPWRLGEVTGL